MPAPNLAPMQRLLAEALSLSKQNTVFQVLQGYSWVLDKLTRELALILSDSELDAALLASALHETLSDEEKAFLLALPDANKHAVVGSRTLFFDKWKSEIFDFFFNPEKTELRLEGSVTGAWGSYADRRACRPAFARILTKASKKLVSLELIGTLDSFGITDNEQAALLNDTDVLQSAFLGLSQLRSLILYRTDRAGLEFLSAILPKMPDLTLLDVDIYDSHSPSPQESFLKVVGDNVPHLKSLKLVGFERHNERSTEDRIISILHKKSLKYLGLDFITADILKSKCFITLESLDLRHCKMGATEDRQIFARALPQMRNLQSLVLNFDGIWNQAELHELLSTLPTLPRLMSLSLGFLYSGYFEMHAEILNAMPGLRTLELWNTYLTHKGMNHLLSALKAMTMLSSFSMFCRTDESGPLLKELMPGILEQNYRLALLKGTENGVLMTDPAIQQALSPNKRLAVVIKEMEECLYYLDGDKPSNQERAAFLDKLDALGKEIQLLTQFDSRYIAVQQVYAYMEVRALSNLLWAEPLDVNGIIRNLYTLQKLGYADFANSKLEKLYHHFSNRVKEVDFSDPLKDQYYFSMLMIATLLTDKDDKAFYSRAAVSGLVGREKKDEQGVVYGREAGFSEDEYAACLSTEEYQVKVVKPLAARLHALGIEPQDRSAPTPVLAGPAPRY